MRMILRVFIHAVAFAGCCLATLATGHAQAVSLDVIQKYAPSIYLNAYDNNHPSSVEDFFAQSTLVDQNGNVISSTVTPAILAANASSSNYLIPTNNVFPTAANDFESGDPIVSAGSNTGQSNAPVYVKTIDHGTYIDLKYYMFYTWNGFQGFQVGVITNFKTQPYFMNWARFASHYGDWEHVTVRISEDTNTLIGVYFSQHGDAQYVTNPSLDGTHPIVYPGWNSHANYPVSGNNINTQILDSPGIIPVSWLKVVDVTTNTGNFVYYNKPNPFYSNGVQWKPWQNTSQLVLLDNNADAAQWLSFDGNWGPTVTNAIDHPPTLPSDASNELYVLAQGGNFLGLLQQYIVGSGPLGPEAAGWNESNEP
jgi:VPS62-like protein